MKLCSVDYNITWYCTLEDTKYTFNSQQPMWIQTSDLYATFSFVHFSVRNTWERIWILKYWIAVCNVYLEYIMQISGTELKSLFRKII